MYIPRTTLDVAESKRFKLSTMALNPTRRVGTQWVLLLLLCCFGFVQTTTDEIVYLERGQQGIVPCPLVQSRQISPSDVLVLYWYYGSLSRASLLISNFNGQVAPQNGIAEGVYDIDNEFSLVIENVTASDEGTYYCRMKQRGRMMEDGQVEVRDKVSPRRPYPTVIGCNQDNDADPCEVRVPHGCRVHDLTCVMEQVKPAVDLRWIHLFVGGKTVINASTTVRSADTGSWLRNNTFSTSSSIQVKAVDHEVFECEAVGVAVGGSSARASVRLTTIQPITATERKIKSSNNPGEVVQANTDGTLYLERGQRGIVPCPLVQSRQISPSDVIVMYWYYDSPSNPSLLISHFYGRVAPQNRIPEGVYDIDNEFRLVIENVTASDEGTYHCGVKPRGRDVRYEHVNVRDKVSSRRPYPTVIGCNQDHDADSCEVRVPHDSRLHDLTCVMEHVKPAVDLRWIHLFWGGKTILDTSTTVLPAYTGSWLRTNTFSTSASIKVEAADDDVYECEALGVAVGGSSARTRVRLTTIHPTTIHPTTIHPTTIHPITATDREVQSSNNPGKEPIVNRDDHLRVALIVMAVTIPVLLFVIVIQSFLMRRYYTQRLESYKAHIKQYYSGYYQVPTKMRDRQGKCKRHQ